MSRGLRVAWASGLAATWVAGATAGVQEVGFSITGDVSDTRIYDGLGDPFDDSSYTFVDNDSFSATGGLELLPFSAAASGGDFFASGGAVNGREGTVRVDLSGGVANSGLLSLSGSNSAFIGLDGGGYPSGSAASVIEVTFRLASSGVYSLSGEASANMDFGSAGGVLRDASGGVIFQWSSFDSTVFSEGALEAGEYRLTTSAMASGSVIYDLTVTPSPSSAFLVACSIGVVGTRRRRGSSR